MKYKELREKRAGLIEEVEGLTNKKVFTDEDSKRSDELISEIDRINAQMETIEAATLKSVKVGPARDGSDDALSIGDVMAAKFKLANEKQLSAREQRALDTANDGDVIDEDAQSSEVLELVRANSVTMAAGVRSIALPAGQKHSIPKLTGSIVPAWRAENAVLSDTEPTFTSVDFTWKSLAASTTISNELLADSAIPLRQVLASEASKAFGLAIDQAILLSDGTGNSITGIASTGSLANVDAAPSAFTNYASLISAISTVKGNDHTPTYILTGTDCEATLAGLTATDNQPLMAPKYVTDLNWLTTTSLEASDIAFVGDFAKGAIFAVREGLEIRMNPYIKSGNNQTVMEMIMRCDFQVSHIEAFCKIEDVV